MSRQVEVGSSGSIQLLIPYIAAVLGEPYSQSFLGFSHILVRTLVAGDTVHQVASLTVHGALYVMFVVATTSFHCPARLHIWTGVAVIWAPLHTSTDAPRVWRVKSADRQS